MNKDQFIYWLKGFVDAAEVSPTQIQWKLIKEKLDNIKDCPDYGSSIGTISTRNFVTDGFIQNTSVTRANPPSTLTTTTGKPVTYTIKDDSKDSKN